MYVCPKCKGPLHEGRCAACQLEFPVVEGIPCFLSDSGDVGQKLRQIYDDIYRHHEDVWIDQGRSDNFMNYFTTVVDAAAGERILEIGCGEGQLLAKFAGQKRYGIDPSIQALMRAKARSGAECAVARAEELPFPSDSFDLAISVGVMEHFADPASATAEIRRVLKPGGRYVVLIQTDMSSFQRARLKAREYIYPRFRPIALLKWLQKKMLHPIVQPLRRSYTLDSARTCLEESGLKTASLITTRSHPHAPLAGDHVAIFTSRKT
jgi:ubiquinone/menaquinone biosynthesis C-methylase UbiE